MALTKVRGDGVQGMSLLSTSTALTLDANGHVTKPLQSAFCVNPASQQANIAPTGNVQIVFGTERFDNNGDFASNAFTAPVTGKYQLQTSIRIDNVDTAGGYYQVKLSTSNLDYLQTISPLFSEDASHWMLNQTILADMDASDTARVFVKQLQGTAQTDIDTESYFSGYLVA